MIKLKKDKFMDAQYFNLCGFTFNNITNQSTKDVSSINFWNYLLFKPRKNNKNNTMQPLMLNESKCLIQL